jgi:hypothetical protein
MTGRTVAGRYLLTGLLGRGGFGTVYSGRDLQGGGEVAVKVFSRVEGFAPRAAREARTAGKLDHPNVHAVLGVERDDEHAYLISELVVGARFDRTELSDEEAVRAIAAVCDALAHAHERQVVHRDVKPSNILVSDEGEVVLTDFGIARDRDAADQTMDEKVLGTLSYMAPEQARGEQATEHTDVWAAALTLYEALCGRNPFRTKSLSDLLDRLSKGAPSLAHQRPDLPKPLTKTIHRALDQDPRKRPTATELRDSLLAALRPEEEADEKEERVPLALPTPRFALRLVAPVSAAVTCAWLLTAFPVYPAAWTAPLAIALGLAAWRWPYASGCALAAIAVPALWNQAEASALLFAPAAILWLRAGRKWGSRMYAPLAAVPLALLGIGPAIVLVAATAPTPRRRALEGAVGGLLAIVAGGTMPAEATRSLAGANNPLDPVTALLGTPAVAVLVLACAVFAPLLHEALERTDGRRGQLLALWTLGFALCTVGLPQALANHEVPLLPAAFAALVAGILAAGWAVVAPRFSFGR